MGYRTKMAYGPRNYKQVDGTQVSLDRVGAQNDEIVSQLHGKLHETSCRKLLYGACSQADTTTSVALTTTYTGFCLSNPAGNTMNLALRQVGISLCVAPVAVSSIGLGGGYAAAGVVTHSTPLTTYPLNLGSADAATGLADDECTLPAGAGAGLLRVIMPMIGGFTAGALFAHGPAVVDMEGSIIIPPGGFVFIYTLTATHGFFGMTWEEFPI
jgi:hypothetical protein